MRLATTIKILDGEKLVSVSQIAKQVPGSRGSESQHPATITRWIVKGIKLRDGSRLRLKADRYGSRWMIKPSDFAQFLRDTTESFLPSDAASPAPRSPAKVRRAAEQAEAALIAQGC